MMENEPQRGWLGRIRAAGAAGLAAARRWIPRSPASAEAHRAPGLRHAGDRAHEAPRRHGRGADGGRLSPGFIRAEDQPSRARLADFWIAARRLNALKEDIRLLGEEVRELADRQLKLAGREIPPSLAGGPGETAAANARLEANAGIPAGGPGARESSFPETQKMSDKAGLRPLRTRAGKEIVRARGTDFVPGFAGREPVGEEDGISPKQSAEPGAMSGDSGGSHFRAGDEPALGASDGGDRRAANERRSLPAGPERIAVALRDQQPSSESRMQTPAEAEDTRAGQNWNEILAQFRDSQANQEAMIARLEASVSQMRSQLASGSSFNHK